jgi:hypothetical protein
VRREKEGERRGREEGVACTEKGRRGVQGEEKGCREIPREGKEGRNKRTEKNPYPKKAQGREDVSDHDHHPIRQKSSGNNNRVQKSYSVRFHYDRCGLDTDGDAEDDHREGFLVLRDISWEEGEGKVEGGGCLRRDEEKDKTGE